MGKLIVIEGLDGSGKGTQGAILFEKLKEKFSFVRALTFPDYNSDSSAPLRMYLNGNISENPMDINAYAASSFFAVDRYISYMTSWKEDYEKGCIFLADRYTTSNAVYQIGKAEDPEEYLNWVWDYEYVKLGLPKPDLVIYLDMDPNVSAKLLLKRYNGDQGKKDIHEKNIDFLKNCRKNAMIVAKNNDWKIVKCSDENEPCSVEEISEKVLKLALECIENG
jgi:dTMP kinase